MSNLDWKRHRSQLSYAHSNRTNHVQWWNHGKAHYVRVDCDIFSERSSIFRSVNKTKRREQTQIMWIIMEMLSWVHWHGNNFELILGKFRAFGPNRMINHLLRSMPYGVFVVADLNSTCFMHFAKIHYSNGFLTQEGVWSLCSKYFENAARKKLSRHFRCWFS